jgi:hypothetical protein
MAGLLSQEKPAALWRLEEIFFQLIKEVTP